jgi:hypothetical protein
MVQQMKMSKHNTAHKHNQEKNHIIILIDAEKSFDKIPHSFMIKSLKKQGIEGMHLNIKKALYN